MTALTRKGFPVAVAMALAGGLAAAALLGVLLASDTRQALILVVAIAALTAAVAIPVTWLPALAVAVTAAVPTLLSLNLLPVLSGQARIGVVVMAVALGRAVQTRLTLRAPPILLAVVGAFGCILLFDAVVDVFAGAPATQSANLYRELLYPAVAVVGFVASGAAREESARLSMFRAIGIVAIGVYVASIVYWAWAAKKLGLPGGVDHLFTSVQKAAGYGTRSVFPFAEDSPNLGAVAFVLAAGLAVPPLLASRTRRDRTLAVAVVLLLVAAVLTTTSRTGLVAIGAGGTAYVVLTARSQLQVRLAVLSAVFLAVLFLAAPSLLPANRGLSARTGTFQARVGIWHQAWNSFAKAPIAGHGYGYSATSVFQEEATKTGSATSRRNSVHSEYLGELVDGGVVGFAIFAGFLALLISLARTLLRSRSLVRESLAFATVLAATLTSMIDSAFTKSAACMTILWLAVGIAVGALARSGVPGGGTRGHA